MKREKKRQAKKTITIILILIIILIIAAFIIFYNKEILVKLSGLVIRQIEKNNTSMLNNTNNSNEIFIIETVTNEDILNDRIKITNTGSESIDEISVEVNGEDTELIRQKTIYPGNSEYFYIKQIFPAGEVSLKVSYKEYSQEISFNAAEDWHIAA